MNPLKIQDLPLSLLLFLLILVTGCGSNRQPAGTATPPTKQPNVQAILAPNASEISAVETVVAVAESSTNTPSIESTDLVTTSEQSVLTVGDMLALVAAEPVTALSEGSTPATTIPATQIPATQIPPTQIPATAAPELDPTSTAVPTPDLRPTPVAPVNRTVATTAAPTSIPATAIPSTAIPATAIPATTIPATAIASNNPAALENPPNELGAVLVLEYHLIEPGEDSTYSRTPESVLADLEWLYANDFYPIKFRDLAEGNIDIPAGKSPVVLAFDDSSIGQFRFLADGTVDPTSAMGVILDFAASHADFPPVITAFPLLDVDVPSRILWGQPELSTRKLQMIVEWGGEVGSHTVSHERLDLVSEERIQWQLANSTKWLADRIGNGYEIRSLALPLGAYPLNEALLRSGQSEGLSYRFTGAAEVAGGPAFSPFSTGHDPYHIRRAQAVPGYIDNIYAFLENRPSLKYTSDGDPQTITIPSEATLDEEQRGTFVDSAWPGYRVVRYERE